MDTDKLRDALRFCANQANGWNCPNCPGFDSLCSTDKEIRITAADALEAKDAQLTELQSKYDRLNDFEQTQCAKLLMKLTESERQLAAAVEDLHGLCWCCAYGDK